MNTRIIPLATTIGASFYGGLDDYLFIQNVFLLDCLDIKMFLEFWNVFVINWEIYVCGLRNYFKN